MPQDNSGDYLEQFVRRARDAGLDLKRPGSNWVAARDLARGSHVSLSISRHQIQVNLNNENDEERSVFERLYRDRATIAEAIGVSLAWEKKEGRKKTAVRATLEEGYADLGSWDRQHEWALATMKKFEREFGRLLSKSRSV